MRFSMTDTEARALVAAALAGLENNPSWTDARKSDVRRGIGIIEDVLRFAKPSGDNYADGQWTGEPPASGMW